MDADQVQTYFASPGPITSLGSRKHYFDDLPADIPEICHLIQGIMLHVHWAERYGVQLSPKRREELNLRFVARQLDRIMALDDHSLSDARPLEKRIVGNCRDFSVMLTAILRHHHVPARSRCGFGRYFTPSCYEDHWVCEYWHPDQQRWILVDAQLDAFQCEQLAITFDPIDVPRDQFITGGKAWQLCRREQADPGVFGIFDMRGLWYVRGNFIRDIAALNKMELLPWDVWGIMETGDQNDDAETLQFLDELAEWTTNDVPQFNLVQQAYEADGRAVDSRVYVPTVIHSHCQNGLRRVDLSAMDRID